MTHTATAVIPTDTTAFSIFTLAERARLDEFVANRSLEERADELRRRGMSQAIPPAQKPATEKTIRVHDCFEYGLEAKPARCGCNLYVTREEAQEIIRAG